MHAALLLVLSTTLAPAGVVHRRQKRQHARIQHGIRSGEVTPEEAAKLKAEQQKVQADREKAAADGKVTGKERRTIRSRAEPGEPRHPAEEAQPSVQSVVRSAGDVRSRRRFHGRGERRRDFDCLAPTRVLASARLPAAAREDSPACSIP